MNHFGGMNAGLDAFADASEPVSPALLCQDLYSRFSDDPDLMSVAVVEGERPVGLVHRSDFMMRLAHSFGRALYGKKPITSVMDDDPLCVDRGLALERVQQVIATSKPCALIKGFIITTDGRYTALGTALSLIRHSLSRAEQKAAELSMALETARRADAAKSTFLATMSHELRTPLTSIIGFSGLIFDEALGPLDEAYVGYARNIRDSGEHLLSIVGDILDFAKIEHGGLELHEETFDLGEEMEWVARTLFAQAAANGITIDLAVTAPVSLRADARIVRQIALNLASNAVKFTGAGGRVVISSGCDAGAPWLSVEDNGCGMDEAGVALAFQPFQQIENGLNRRHEGTGLGLPLVKAFADAHDARLTLRSAPGVGTAARVVFPTARLNSRTDRRAA